MYSIYAGKKEILMWCFLPRKRPKWSLPRGCAESSQGTTAKRSKIVDSNSKKISEVQEIVVKLQSKHGTL